MKSKEVYCVKCRHSCVPKKVQYERDVRGRLRMVAVCPHCGTKCYKYVAEK